GLPHQEVFAIRERVPVRLDLHADLQFVGCAFDHVGNDINPDIARHTGDGVRFAALKRGWAAVGDSEREHRAFARYLAPFNITAPPGEDTHGTRKVLIFLRGLAVLDDEFLLPRCFPEWHTEIVVFDVAFDAERIVQCDGHLTL